MLSAKSSHLRRGHNNTGWSWNLHPPFQYCTTKLPGEAEFRTAITLLKCSSELNVCLYFEWDQEKCSSLLYKQILQFFYLEVLNIDRFWTPLLCEPTVVPCLCTVCLAAFSTPAHTVQAADRLKISQQIHFASWSGSSFQARKQMHVKQRSSVRSSFTGKVWMCRTKG